MIQMRKYFLASVYYSLLFVSLCATNALATEKDRTSDLWLEAQLTTTYAFNQNLKAFQLSVNVEDGIASLGGTVNEPMEKQLAEDIARSLTAVKEVKNNIRVDHLYRPQQPKDKVASYAQVVEDSSITTRVKSKLLWNKATSGLAIDVNTSDSVVTLQGSVPTQAKVQLAGRIATDTEGVERVINKLTADNDSQSLGSIDLDAAEENARAALDSFGKEVSDSWITTKVRSSIFFSSGIDSSDITVATKNGTVTLSGSVPKKLQREFAEETARDITGVVAVENRLVVR